MWLCTQHGFFSIVRKDDNEYHVRARLKSDAEALRDLMFPEEHRKDVPVQEWPNADYRWRFIIDVGELRDLFFVLAHDLDYDNFKGRIASLPDQRGKMGAYHDLWHAGCGWQREARHTDPTVATRALDLVNTSMDAARSSLRLMPHDEGNEAIVRLMLKLATAGKMKSKAALARLWLGKGNAEVRHGAKDADLD